MDEHFLFGYELVYAQPRLVHSQIRIAHGLDYLLLPTFLSKFGLSSIYYVSLSDSMYLAVWELIIKSLVKHFGIVYQVAIRL